MGAISLTGFCYSSYFFFSVLTHALSLSVEVYRTLHGLFMPTPTEPFSRIVLGPIVHPPLILQCILPLHPGIPSLHPLGPCPMAERPSTASSVIESDCILQDHPPSLSKSESRQWPDLRLSVFGATPTLAARPVASIGQSQPQISHPASAVGGEKKMREESVIALKHSIRLRDNYSFFFIYFPLSAFGLSGESIYHLYFPSGDSQLGLFVGSSLSFFFFFSRDPSPAS